MISFRCAIAAAVAVTVVGGGSAVATAASTADPARSAVRSAARPTLSVHTTKKHTVAAPHQIRPGRVHLRNTGAIPIIAVQPRHSAGAAQLLRDLSARTGKKFDRDFVSVASLPGKSDVFVRTSRGKLFLVDTSAYTDQKSSVATIEVAGKTVNAALPKSQSMSAGKKGKLNVPATLARKVNLSVTNRSAQTQEILATAVSKAVTATQLNAFLADPSLERLFDVANGWDLDFLAFLSPHRSETLSHKAKAGRYLFFMLSASGSDEPELTKGTVRLVTVK